MDVSSMLDGGKKGKEIDSSNWREEIGNRNRLVNLAGSCGKRDGRKMLFSSFW